MWNLFDRASCDHTCVKMADRSTSRGYSLKIKDGHQMINSLRIQSFLFTARLRFPPGIPWAPNDIFFLSILILHGEAASRRREASREPYKPRKHGLFHIRYLENGPLEPGYSWQGYAKYRDLSVSRRSIICRSRRLGQIIDILAIDKSRYFAQPRLIIRSHVVT